MFKMDLENADQIANICWIIEEASEFQKNIYFRFIDYAKAFDCVDHNKLWKILQEMGIPDHGISQARVLEWAAIAFSASVDDTLLLNHRHPRRRRQKERP